MKMNYIYSMLYLFYYQKHYTFVGLLFYVLMYYIELSDFKLTKLTLEYQILINNFLFNILIVSIFNLNYIYTYIVCSS